MKCILLFHHMFSIYWNLREKCQDDEIWVTCFISSYWLDTSWCDKAAWRASLHHIVWTLPGVMMYCDILCNITMSRHLSMWWYSVWCNLSDQIIWTPFDVTILVGCALHHILLVGCALHHIPSSKRLSMWWYSVFFHKFNSNKFTSNFYFHIKSF